MSEFEHIKSIIQRALPARREIMLCKKCQIWADTIQVKSHQPPWQHCHHEEPEIDYQKPWREAVEKLLTWTRLHQEKPEEESGERCWCEYSILRRNSWICLESPVDTQQWLIKFCPHCGKKL